MLFYFGCLLYYRGLDTIILSAILFILINPLVINTKLAQSLSNDRVIKIVDSIYLFILSLFSLVPKYGKGFQKIYHLLYQKSSLFNNYISAK